MLGTFSYANAQEFSEFFTIEYGGKTYQSGETIVFTDAEANIDDPTLVDYAPHVKVINLDSEPRMLSLDYQYDGKPSKAEAEADMSWGLASLCYNGGYTTPISGPSGCLNGFGNSASTGMIGVPANGTNTCDLEPHLLEVDPTKDSTYKLVLVAMEGMPEEGMGFDGVQELSDQAVLYFRFCSKENGVDEITLDANAPKEYFDLQGRKVANPAAGLYIVKQGSKAYKTVIR